MDEFGHREHVVAIDDDENRAAEREENLAAEALHGSLIILTGENAGEEHSGHYGEEHKNDEHHYGLTLRAGG